MRAAVLVVALAGCTNFDFIEANQCGNGILETGEDCDLVAGAPGAASCIACRHACSDDPNLCPPGWGCGDDGVCRHGTLRFDEFIAPVEVAVTDYAIDDLDGDPFPDAIGYGPTEIWLARGTPGPGFEIVDRYARTRADVRPAIGDVDGSAFLLFDEQVNPRVTLDLAMSTGPRGVAMFRTVSGRLVPAPQPWFRLGVAPNATIPMRTAASAPHHELVRVGDAPQLVLAIEHPDHAPSVGPIPVIPGCNVNLVQLAAGDLDGDGRDELVVGCELNVTLLVFGTALDGDAALLVPRETLTLPEPLRGPIVLGDLDGDDVPDVLATTAPDPFAPVEDFAVFRQTAPIVFAAATQDARLGGDTVLAMADLDGDGTTDVIGDGGAYLARGAVLERALTAPVTWRDAAAADVNGDDVLDVVGASDGRIDTLVARGDGTYTLHVALTVGLFDRLAIGDLDGDGLDDIATKWSGNPSEASVQIVYGRDDGGLDAPVSAGPLFANVTGFAVADFVVPGSLLAADGAADLMVSIDDQVFVFAGAGARPPLASLDTGEDPRLIALGRFDPFADQEDLAGLDLLTMGTDLAHATAFYGNSTSIRDLDDRYALDADVSSCVNTPPVFTVADLDQFNGAELIEATCLDDGPALRHWQIAGVFGAPVLTVSGPGPQVPGGNPRVLSAVDLDGDLGLDLIAAHDGGIEQVSIFHNRGTGLDEPPARLTSDLVAGVAAGNLDDDLALELLVGGDGFAMAFDYDPDVGATALLDPDQDPLDLLDWRFPQAGIPRLVDLDGDGVLDLVLGGAQLRAFRGRPNRE